MFPLLTAWILGIARSLRPARRAGRTWHSCDQQGMCQQLYRPWDGRAGMWPQWRRRRSDQPAV